MKTRNSIVCCLIALLALPVLGAFAGTPAEFSVQLVTTFDYPGAGPYWTQPQKINDMGDIAGAFVDTSLVERGFSGSKTGTSVPRSSILTIRVVSRYASASIIHDWSPVSTSMELRAPVTGFS